MAYGKGEGNLGYPTKPRSGHGGEPAWALLADAGAETSIALQRRNLVWVIYPPFCKFLGKQPSDSILFCHFMLMERKDSWCHLKWQNHRMSVRRNATGFMWFSFHGVAVGSSVLHTFIVNIAY